MNSLSLELDFFFSTDFRKYDLDVIKTHQKMKHEGRDEQFSCDDFWLSTFFGEAQ
jgi:hypothetical protein